MKIKFLLMPFAIVVAIVLSVWHIWPAWFDKNMENSIVILNEDIDTKEKEIKNIKERKQNVNKLTGDLQSDIATKDLVFGYYPIVRKEEDVINKINYIALGSGVILEEIAVDYGKIGKKNSSEVILAIPVEENSTEDTLSNIEKTLASTSGSVRNPGFVTAEIKINGDYIQIKEFLRSLYITGLLNNIQSFDIYRKESGNDDEDENSNKLNAYVKANFGYISEKDDQAVILINNAIFKSGNFDIKAIDDNKDLMSEKYPNSDIESRGTSNPFIP